jgi:hypothetical protein
MSEENVQLQHRGAGAFNPARPRAFLALCGLPAEVRGRAEEILTPAPETVVAAVGPPPSTSTRRELSSISEIEGVLELGDVKVVRLRVRGHGVGSDASMNHTSWFVTEAQSQGHLVGRVPERGRGS